MDTPLDSQQLATAFSAMFEESEALEKMHTLIGYSPGFSEADMEASLLLEVLLLLRDRGVDVRLRQRCCLIVEEDGIKTTTDAFYTLCHGQLEVDVGGRTDLDAIARAWFSHYCEGHTYGGIGPEGMITLPANPVHGAMREYLAPHVDKMISKLHAQALHDSVPEAANARARPRM